MADKVNSLLARLRGEEPEPEPELEAPPPMMDTPVASGPPVDLGPIEEKIAALEAKIAELEAPPLEAPPMEEMPPALNEPPPEPPQPPTQLTMFLQTRMELLERKLEMAQRDAVRSNMILREREDAQRKAQKEVEDLFRRIREQQRAAGFDRELRRNYSDAQEKIDDLQRRLTLSELRMVPAEDVLRCLEGNEGRAELERRIRIQLAKAEAGGLTKEEAGEKPSPPGPDVACAPISGDIESISVLLGRIADLEARLEESEEQREKERQSRSAWESRILESMKSSRRQWQKAGGPELLVEAALESLVDSIGERDRLQLEMGKLVTMLQDEPPDSRRTPALRARLAQYQSKMDEMQGKIGKQMALVEAWVKRNKEGSE